LVYFQNKKQQRLHVQIWMISICYSNNKLFI